MFLQIKAKNHSIPIYLSLDVINPFLAVTFKGVSRFSKSFVFLSTLQSDRDMIKPLMIILSILFRDLVVNDELGKIL